VANKEIFVVNERNTEENTTSFVNKEIFGGFERSNYAGEMIPRSKERHIM
jgi:hypothetical protein